MRDLSKKEIKKPDPSKFSLKNKGKVLRKQQSKEIDTADTAPTTRFPVKSGATDLTI
jgi:hypothetical protein